jgi:Protein of unknown function, DUF481
MAKSYPFWDAMMRARETAIALFVIALAAVPAPAQSSSPNPQDPRSVFTTDLLAKPLEPLSLLNDSPLSQVLARVWSASVELGLNGTSGNTDLTKLHLGLYAKRKTDSNTMATDLMYGFSRQDGTVTENKVMWGMHDEMRMGQSNWAPIMANAVEYDQFRAFALREAMHGGMSRTWYENDFITLKTRMGAGSSFDMNMAGPSRVVPEGMFGYDAEIRITERQRIVSCGDYFPDMASWAQFRIRVRAAYEFLIDPEFGLILRFGIMERYDSQPGPGTLPNDFDYFATLMMKF